MIGETTLPTSGRSARHLGGSLWAVAAAGCILVLGTAAVAETAVDLAQRYPATLDFSQRGPGLSWTCDQRDVWRLTQFTYSMTDSFRLSTGPAEVVFGCHGTDVLWAAVFPDEPGEIAAAAEGQGEHPTSVWLRFHPARLGELFPPDTVLGQGKRSMVPRGKRLAALKMSSCWQAGGRPKVPWKRSITVDVETREGPRRFYSIDTRAGTVEYVDAFRMRTVPKPKPIDRVAALEAFDTVWRAFDREYAMFVVKPDVDWASLRDVYRPQAESAQDNIELGMVLAEMIACLQDLHAHVQVDGETLPGYQRRRPLNGSFDAVSRLVGPVTNTRQQLAYARSDDGIGYINVYGLQNRRLPELFDEALQKMEASRGLIVDLRFNGGGSEPLGQQMAGRFLDKRRVYSLNQYRNGPKHEDLGTKLQRACEPAGPWRYVGPVIVLQGQRTMSSAESFLLMLAQCPQATTMGDRSAGSSGNPRRVQAAGGIIVNLPRWLDMEPSGRPIDAVGILPEVPIEATPEDFTAESDPVLAAALKNLRDRPPHDTASGSQVLRRRDDSP